MSEFGVRVPMAVEAADGDEIGIALVREYQVGSFQFHVNTAGSGEPLVVLHHSTGPFWSEFYDRLADSFTVIAPDMPGYGRSERPERARTPGDLAVFLHQLLDVMDVSRTHFVGLGFGGYVAAEMVAMNQRRATTLTLVGSAGLRPREGFIHDPMTESWNDYVRESFGDHASFDAMFGPDPAKELIDLWDYSREMTARLTWKPWMWSLVLPDMLRAVAVPTQVVWGQNDRIVPLDCAHQFVELLQDARLEIVEDAGHVVDFEKPDQLARLVRAFTNNVARL